MPKKHGGGGRRPAKGWDGFVSARVWRTRRYSVVRGDHTTTLYSKAKTRRGRRKRPRRNRTGLFTRRRFARGAEGSKWWSSVNLERSVWFGIDETDLVTRNTTL